MKLQEIKAKDLKPKKFIAEKVREIREMAGDVIAISALPGGVGSLVVTIRRERYFGKLSSKGTKGGCLTGKDLPGGFPEKSPLLYALPKLATTDLILFVKFTCKAVIHLLCKSTDYLSK